jgi:hypothetical protein
MRVKIVLAAKNLRRNLVLLQRDTWLVQGVPGKVAQQFTKGFRPVESVAADQPVDFAEDLRAVEHSNSPSR